MATTFRDPRWPSGLSQRGKWFYFRRMKDGDRKERALGTKNLNEAISQALEWFQERIKPGASGCVEHAEQVKAERFRDEQKNAQKKGELNPT